MKLRNLCFAVMFLAGCNLSASVIVYTTSDLSGQEAQAVKQQAESVILKDGIDSPERLLWDTTLFLHRSEQGLPGRVKRILDDARSAHGRQGTRKVLVGSTCL